jgi:hypothetical protein
VRSDAPGPVSPLRQRRGEHRVRERFGLGCEARTDAPLEALAQSEAAVRERRRIRRDRALGLPDADDRRLTGGRVGVVYRRALDLVIGRARDGRPRQPGEAVVLHDGEPRDLVGLLRERARDAQLRNDGERQYGDGDRQPRPRQSKALHVSSLERNAH